MVLSNESLSRLSMVMGVPLKSSWNWRAVFCTMTVFIGNNALLLRRIDDSHLPRRLKPCRDGFPASLDGGSSVP
jgi:hypothetical protein